MGVHMGLTLVTALVIAAIAAGLCMADGRSWPTALLVAGAAAGGTLGIASAIL